jgi:PEGA domain
MSTIMKRSTRFALLVAVLVLTFSGAAQAQRLRGGFGVRVVPRWNFNLGVGPYYDPFWGPYYPYGFYPGIYPYVVENPTAVRVEGVPKGAQAFVDGYFAGTSGRVPTTPGGHAITLYLAGYRTITEHIYVAPGSTLKMKESMDKLAAGEVSAPPPAPTRAPQPEMQAPAGTSSGTIAPARH